MNPFANIRWITFRPLKGIVTKHDQAKMRKTPHALINYAVDELSVHFPTEELAFQRLSEIRGLNKEYEFFIYTDKQFGRRKYGEPLESILTKKQIADRGLIR